MNRPDDAGSHLARREHDAWDRWLPIWHVIFVAGLATTTAMAWLEGDLLPNALPTIALLAVLAVGYALLFVRRLPWDIPLPIALGYAVVVGLTYAALLRQSPTYFWLQPVLFSQFFFIMPIRWALVPIAFLSAIVIEYQVELSEGHVDQILPQIAGALLTLGFFVVFSFWIGAIIEQSGERKELIEQLERTRRELAETERHAGIAEERERLARELHDTLAQDLTGILAHLRAADAAPDASVASRHREEAARIAHDGIAETRRVLWALRPSDLERGTLVETLERTVEGWRSKTGVRATLTVTGDRTALHPDVEVALLRGAQEALANAGRHASAREVTLTLSYLGDVVTLDVHDDGIGFDPLTPAGAAGGGEREGGLGLVGMRERAERLGGSLAVESAPGEGTTIGLTLPALSASAS